MKTHIYLKWSDEIGDSALVWRKDSDLEGIAKLDALRDWIEMLAAEYNKELDALHDRASRNFKASHLTLVS